MKKRTLAVLLSMGLAVSSLFGCTFTASAEEEGTEAETAVEADAESGESGLEDLLTDTYYIYAFNADGLEMTYFFHFYDEIEGLGRVFYAGLVSNQMNYAGTYEVLDETCDYACYEGRESEDITEGTAQYTVVFYDFDGNEMDRLGLDEGILYNDSEVITGVAGTPNFYYKDDDPENSEYADTYEAEAGQKIADFVADDEVTSTITLYHDGTYVDLVNMMIEGTWSVAIAQDGSRTYSLTPDTESDASAELAVAAGGATAVYTLEGENGIAMTSTMTSTMTDDSDSDATVLSGDMDVADLGITVNVIITVTDEEAVVTLDVYGSTSDVDAGTVVTAEDGSMTFTFENAGEIQTETDADGNVTLEYVLAGTDIGDVDCVVTLQ